MSNSEREYVEAVALWEGEVRKYEKSYPGYCKKCLGWGGKLWIDHEGRPQRTDCPCCVHKNHCPRCGEQLELVEKDTYADELICPDCGWGEESLGLPEKPLLEEFLEEEEEEETAS